MKKNVWKRIAFFMPALVLILMFMPVRAEAAPPSVSDEGFTLTLTNMKYDGATQNDLRFYSPYMLFITNNGGGQYSFTYMGSVYGDGNNSISFKNGLEGSFTWNDCTQALNHTFTVTGSVVSYPSAKPYELTFKITKNALGSHSTKEVTATEPTCTTTGLMKTVCANCAYVQSTTPLPIVSTAHSYTYTSLGNGKHQGVCSHNSAHTTVEEDCSGGTAACSAAAVCQKCKTAYGSTTAHTWTNWKYDANAFVNISHYRTCTVCNPEGKQYVDTGYESEMHSYSEATCVQRAKCKCGKEDGSLAAHAYTYTKDGNTIKQVCAHSESHNSSISIEKNSGASTVYTGSEIKALKVKEVTSGYAFDVTDIPITYSNNINVGTAKGTITLGGYTIEGTFEITPALLDDAAITLDRSSFTYDGTPKRPAYTVTLDGFGTLEEGRDYEAICLGAGKWDNGVPTKWFGNPATSPDSDCIDVGMYGVIIRGVDGGNFQVSAAKASTGVFAAFTIDKAQPTAEMFRVVLPEDAVYTGNDSYSAEVTGNKEGLGAFTVKYNGQTAAPSAAGTYTVTVDVEESTDYAAVTGLQLGQFTVAKAEGSATVSIEGWEYGDTANAPVPASGTNGTENVTYQYKVKDADDTTYTNEVPTEAGTYTVKATFAATNNYSEVSATADFEIVKADPGIGVVTASEVYNTLETSAIILSRENATVEGVLAVDADQILACGDNIISYTFTPNDTANYKTITGTVPVTVVDTVVPTGIVTVSTKSWAEFLNNITFDLFFKETQTVSVRAFDNLSGVARIEYIESETAMDLDAVKAAAQWTEMKNGSTSVTASDAKQFVYYIRITDNVGNVSYLSTDGAEYDTTAPVIEGVDDGVTYYTTQAVTVIDKNIDTITLNNEVATGSITLEGNKEANYTIVAIDKAGNSTTVTVAMKPIRVLAEATKDLAHDNVTSANIPALEALVEKLDELLADEDINDNGERETLEQHKTIAESLLQTAAETAAEKKAVTDKAAEFDGDAVKSADKAELEKLAEDIDALLDTNNLTQDERTALETLLEQVEDMIDTINKTAADSKTATDAVDAYDPSTVKSTDKSAIETALNTIEDLLDTEHLTAAERETLENAKKEAEALLGAIDEAAKAADTDNTAKVEDVTADNVTPDDKSNLEKAKADLEDALENNGGNYTEEEKQAIQDKIQRIDDAIEALGNVEDVTDAIAQLPETVEPDDEEAAEKILDAKASYDALTDHEKSLVDDDAKKKLDDLVAALTAYDIIKGDGGKWTKGSDGSLSFTANGPFSKFVGIKVDGKEVDEQYYEAKSGSTIITLKQSYLQKLSIGGYTITVVYTDGETSGTFKILAQSTTPATGDDSNIMLYSSVFAVSLAAIIVLLLAQKKRKQENA